MGQMVTKENSFIAFCKKLHRANKIVVTCPTHGKKRVSIKQYSKGIYCYKCHHLSKRTTAHNWFTP